MSVLRTARWVLGRAVDAGLASAANRALIAQGLVHRRRNADAGFGDDDHLHAAAGWLGRAQDVTGDGGVSGRYQLRGGWTSSYPETTGYIVPTFLALADALDDPSYRTRAQRAVEFLLGIQLANGAFPGGELRENTVEPSIFNTAQILNGLTAWHAATRDARALEAATRAAEWLAAQQAPDGAWRQHIYRGLVTTYSAHATCWLAEFGAHVSNDRYLAVARRHLQWVLAQQDPETGWFDLAGFSAEDHAARRALTHTIAYTVWGVLATAELVDDARGIEAARRAAAGIARRLELSRWLPGVLDHRWRGLVPFACLTGNAQMALIWLRLFERDGDARWVNAALKAIDLVKAAQAMRNPGDGIRGGIAGADPVWGEYIYMAVPNWPAKFFIDALLAKRATMERLRQRALDHAGHAPPPRLEISVPRALPPLAATAAAKPLRVVMLTRAESAKVPQMIAAWSGWGFRPAAVVVEHPPATAAWKRLTERVRDDGFRPLFARVLGRRVASVTMASEGPVLALSDVATVCRREGIPLVDVAALTTPAAVSAIRALAPDVLVHAGAGILRAPVLEVPTLGTLNVHMGVLPPFRGMNVAEWAALTDGPVGCTVHLVDVGIDTGDILCVREMDAGAVATRAELRHRVDEAQIALLGEVLRWMAGAGALPPRRVQREDEGRQFFAMHPELLLLLEARLAHRAAPVGVRVPPEADAERAPTRMHRSP